MSDKNSPTDVARQVEQSYGAGWSAGYEAKGRERPPEAEDDDIKYDTPVLSHRDEYGWLIEATTPDGVTTWWTGESARGISWSREAFSGIRYARRADAEKQIADWEPTMWPWPVRATEHGFARSTQPNSPRQDSRPMVTPPVLSGKDSIEYDTPVLPRIPTGGTTASDSMRVEKRADDRFPALSVWDHDSDEIKAVRERVLDPDPDGVMSIDGLYADASTDRAALLDLLDEAVREKGQEALGHLKVQHASAIRIRELEAMRQSDAVHLNTVETATGSCIRELTAENNELLFNEKNLLHRLENAIAAQDKAEAERDKYLTQNSDLRKMWEEMRTERDKAVAGWGMTAALKGELNAARSERDELRLNGKFLLDRIRTANTERDTHDRASEAMRLNLQTRISERDVRIGELEAERDALRATISSEIADAMILRRRYGAKDDETYPAFVARLVAERDAWKQKADTIAESTKLWKAERDALAARVERLRETLRWYGDESNHIDLNVVDIEVGYLLEPHTAEIDMDNGERARAALEETEG